MPKDSKAAEDIFPINNRARQCDGRTWCQHVREFSNTAAGGELPLKPVMMTLESVNFIRKMLNSEMDELERDVKCFWNSDESGDTTKDYVKVADALIDAIYYLMDCAAKHGINLDPLFMIVQRANMAKFKNGVIKRNDGKILKPADWEDPEPKLIVEMRKQLGLENGKLES